MKSFGKLIVTIIVVAVVGFIVGFLFMNGAKKEGNTNEMSGDNKQSEINYSNFSGDDFGKVVEIVSGDAGHELEIISGDNSGEKSDSEAEATISKEEIIRNIDGKVFSIVNSDDEVNNVRDKLSLDLVNDLAKSFMKYFKQDELSVAINTKPGLIEIIPDVDFVENMVYYFDKDGDLILYESVSTTVGGSCKYYFNKGKGVSVIVAYEEDIDYKEEYIGDILNRAKLLYDKYANN